MFNRGPAWRAAGPTQAMVDATDQSPLNCLASYMRKRKEEGKKRKGKEIERKERKQTVLLSSAFRAATARSNRSPSSVLNGDFPMSCMTAFLARSIGERTEANTDRILDTTTSR